MDAALAFLIDLLHWLNPVLEILGPTLVAILTVPIMGIIKKVWTWIGTLQPWLQQIIVVLLANGLTWLGAALNLALPTDLSLFFQPEVSGLLSAAMAMAIHAGKKAKG